MKTIALLIVFAANVVLAAYYLHELYRLRKWEKELQPSSECGII